MPDIKNYKVSEQFYNEVINITIPNNSSYVETYQIKGYNLKVDRMTINMKLAGVLYFETTASLEDVTILIKEQGRNNLMNNAMNIWAFKRLGEHDNFKGFVIGANTILELTLAHTKASWTNDVVVQVIFSGSVISNEKADEFLAKF